MATATYTCTVFNATPKAVHTGDQTVQGSLLWGATSTVGDVAFLAKVPHGAKIVDFAEYHSTGASAQTIDFGLDRGAAAGGGGNASVFIAAGAQNARNNMLMNRAKFPLVVSLSDLDPVRYAILKATVASGTTTTSLFINFRLTYRFDGPDSV